MTADEILSTTVADLLAEEDIWFYLLSRMSVEDRGHTSSCWVMISKADRTYYDMTPSRRKYGWRAHQVAYRIWIDEIPTGYEVHHKCQCTNCINPDHLEVVTREEHARLTAAYSKISP